MAEAIRVQVNQTILELIQGNIVLQDTEAIVNAANTSLLGGGEWMVPFIERLGQICLMSVAC